MNKGQIKIILRNLQIETDKLYKEYGATDEIIELQSAINGLRHVYDIPDEREMIYEEFVQ